jgi:hypothetical protein
MKDKGTIILSVQSESSKAPNQDSVHVSRARRLASRAEIAPRCQWEAYPCEKARPTSFLLVPPLSLPNRREWAFHSCGNFGTVCPIQHTIGY